MKPPEGNVLIDGMDAAEYHAAEALSASGAKKLLQSPAHYKLMRDQPSEPSDAMLFGTAVHCAVLEPDAFTKRYVVLPEVNRRTTVGKAAIAEFHAANPGCALLDRETYARVYRCADAVRAHPAAAELLAGAKTEQSLFWEDAKYKVPCKARWDIFSNGGVTDLKTCPDASPESFARSIVNFQYHVQGAHYLSAGEHVQNETPRFFCIIAVESEPPHAVAVYSLGSASILAGMHLMNIALERYAAALAAGEWPGYPETIQQIEIPPWARRFYGS